MAAPGSKILFFGAVFLLNLSTLVFVWFVSPISTFKPKAPVFATTPSSLISQVRKKPKAIISKPSRLVLPSIGIDLPVLPGQHNNQNDTWDIANYKAFYATPSDPINNITGDTLIYGHANNTVFANLKNITPGSELVVYTESGKVFHYSFVSSKNYQPDDLSIFDYRGPPIVTLQTCSGAWSQWRELFTFSLVKVTNT